MARFERIIHTNRDIPLGPATTPIAQITAGSASDPAAPGFAVGGIPHLKYSFLPKQYNEGDQGLNPINRMALRVAGFISQAAANTVGVVANTCDIRLDVYRNSGGASVFQGSIAYYSFKVATTIGTAITAGNINTVVTVTPASMAGIVNGMALGVGSGGTFEVVIATQVTATTFAAQFNQLHAGGDAVTSILVPGRLIPFVPADAASTNSASSTVGAPGSATITPASMYGIHLSDWLLVDTGGSQEAVQVTALTATTFTATFANTHGAAFAIVTNPVTGKSSFNSAPFELREDDTIFFTRLSNNVTGLQTPAGVLQLEWVPSRLLQ